MPNLDPWVNQIIIIIWLTKIVTINITLVYLVDAETNRVQKFRTDGTFVKEWYIN